MTFRFCAVLVALCAAEPRSMDSLGTQHRAKESNTNRMKSGIQAQGYNIMRFFLALSASMAAYVVSQKKHHDIVTPTLVGKQ